MKNGVTFIELLIVIAIISVIGVSTTPFLSNFIIRNSFHSAKDRAVSVFRKAQHYSMDGKAGSIWGVCITANSIRLYRGSCLSPTFSEDLSYSSTVTISPSFDITFSSRGEPSSSQVITVSGADNSAKITIGAAGSIDVN